MKQAAGCLNNVLKPKPVFHGASTIAFVKENGNREDALLAGVLSYTEPSKGWLYSRQKWGSELKLWIRKDQKVLSPQHSPRGIIHGLWCEGYFLNIAHHASK